MNLQTAQVAQSGSNAASALPPATPNAIVAVQSAAATPARRPKHPGKTVPRAMTIRDWPESERPREKLLERGAQALSDAELVALLLGSGI